MLAVFPLTNTSKHSPSWNKYQNKATKNKPPQNQQSNQPKKKKSPTSYAGHQHSSGDTLVRSCLPNWHRQPLKQTVRTKLGQCYQSCRLRERIWKAQKTMDYMQKLKIIWENICISWLFFSISDSWDPAQILYVLFY